MSGRLLLWSITASLAGFLFGFDTVVISGAEATIEELWDLSEFGHGLVIGAALWGTVLGALVGGWPTDRWGRKMTLVTIGALYISSALWSAFATGPYSFAIARLIGGFGVGISTVAAPLYIAEISPAASRGRLAGMFQFNIVLGILIAYLSNALLVDVGEHAWRWMLGVEAIPAIIYAVMCVGLPESPRWLIVKRGDRSGAIRVFTRLRPKASTEELEREADAIARTAVAGAPAASMRKSEAASTAGFSGSAGSANASVEPNPYAPAGAAGAPNWSERAAPVSLARPLMLAFLIAAFNQLSGINVILYFAPRILELAGLETQAALLQSVGIGVVNLVFTMLGLFLIDFVGRKTLLIVGSIGYISSLGWCSWAFYSEHFAMVPYAFFLFIAAHAVGQGAVIWVFISEIFPNKYRAWGQTLGSSTHWIFAALLATIFPQVATVVAPSMIFLFFCSMMVLQLLWVLTMVPETKGVPLEELERQLGVAQ